jgi:methyl-accepting chemotaxis protein
MTQSGRFLFWSRSIKARLFSVIALFAVAMALLLLFQTWRSVDQIYSARKQQLQFVIDAAHAVVSAQYAAFQAGRLTEAEAQERAKSVLRAMRYNGSGYLFVSDDNLVTIVHGAKPDQEGVNGRGQKDPTGKFFTQEMHDVAANQGQGYVSYQYAKPGASLDHPSPKLSYVKFFAPWRWTIGTGVYIDDLNAMITRELLLGSGVALALCLAIGLVCGRIVLRLSRRLGALSEATTALAAGQLDREPPRATGADEVDRMTQALRVFYEAAQERARLETTAKRAQEDADASRAQFDRERAEKERKLEAAASALGAGLAKLAKGELDHVIARPFDAGLDALRVDFNAAVEKLRETLRAIRESAEGMRRGVHEIASASDDLSARTEQQAAQHEKLAASLDEITATLKTSASGVRSASELAAVANRSAGEGAAVVKDAVRAMDGISQSSAKIAQIIGVIDEIAFQTNLLALNAGVEAARAGEAGRGFAVVASEVRALAQRSAEAAKEIKDLISASTAQVEAGVRLVTDTGAGLESIMSRVSEIDRVIADLARGAAEQTTGLQEVNESVNAMDRVTQQNATMAEQANAASRSLSNEAAQLVEMIGAFKLGHGAEMSRRAA